MALDLNGMRAFALQAAEREVGLKALALQAEIQLNLSKAGTGRQYGRHRASAPGEAPAVDTGRLRQSISAVKVGPGYWQVGTNLDFAPMLEFGNRFIRARPAFRPALDKLRVR